MNEQNGSTVLVIETVEAIPSFLTETVDLKRIAKDLGKASSKAVEILLKMLESKDERVQLQAATKLLEFHVSVAKEISSDQLQRLIAEIKIARPANGKQLVDASGPKKPVVDFTTIRTIG